MPGYPDFGHIFGTRNLQVAGKARIIAKGMIEPTGNGAALAYAIRTQEVAVIL